MQKNTIRSIGLCLLFLIAAFLVYNQLRSGDISASFSGIELSKSTQVRLIESTNNYNCSTGTDLSTLENGSIIQVTCTNKLLGFLNIKKSVTVEGLLTVNLPDKSLMVSAFDRYLSKNYDLRSQIAEGSAPTITLSAVNEETGITQHLVYLTKNGTYTDFIIGNLYTRDGQLFQLRGEVEYDTIEPGVILSNIQPEQLDSFVDMYLEKGVQKLDNSMTR